jgi:hydrogenase maturation protease
LKTVVLGIGNLLLGDEGAGIHALRLLESHWEHNKAPVEFIDGGTLSFTLAEIIQDADNLIIIDAAELNDEPGRVMVYENEGMDDFVSNGKCSSVHEVSISELMDIARLTGNLPTRRALVGIQPRDIDWSETPSPPVARGIQQACEHAVTLLEAWH